MRWRLLLPNPKEFHTAPHMLRLLRQHVEYQSDKLWVCVSRNRRSMRYGDHRNHYNYKNGSTMVSSVCQWTRSSTAWTYGIYAVDKRGHLKISLNDLEFYPYVKNDGHCDCEDCFTYGRNGCWQTDSLSSLERILIRYWS